MEKEIKIQSHKGEYIASFDMDALDNISNLVEDRKHFIIDAKVASLYGEQLKSILESSSVLLIEATEENKSLDKFTGYVEHLVQKKMRRNHTLCAIGGGIIQDITCFLASNLFRGVAWEFIPTTLLAQADSCIGSKSSINVSDVKNIMGNFYPPKRVVICTKFLKTLQKREIQSGVGEILKVHVIDGPKSYDDVSSSYDRLFNDDAVLEKYIYKSLLIKKEYIEKDEFDRGIRNIFNYGHSFGHAIESATNFKIPHGVAVSIGMDMANFVAKNVNSLSFDDYKRMHTTLRKNYVEHNSEQIDFEKFISAISKDKKNVDNDLVVILPSSDSKVSKVRIPNDKRFQGLCQDFFSEVFYPNA